MAGKARPTARSGACLINWGGMGGGVEVGMRRRIDDGTRCEVYSQQCSGTPRAGVRCGKGLGYEDPDCQKAAQAEGAGRRFPHELLFRSNEVG